jgi:hypothetical protein
MATAGVILVTALVGLLTNWSGGRPKMLRNPVRFWTAFAGAIALVVALTIVQKIVEKPGSTDGTATRWGSPGSMPPVTIQPPSTTSPGGGTLFLDQLPVDLGAGYVQRSLPRGLTGRSGYDHPLVIACATGQPTDQFREVRYALFKRYLTLTATVDAYESSPDESLVQVRFFRDSQPPVDRTIQVATSAGLTLDLAGVDTLVVRVTCQAPSASAILANARLQHT